MVVTIGESAMMFAQCLSWIFALLSTAAAFAASQPLRELTPDRPDKTESPYSVDAGHIQIESSVLNRAQNAEATDFLNVNFKIGLNSKMDFQTVFTPLHIQPDARGNSDLMFRLKCNIVGNDQPGVFAVGVMPYVSFPTAKAGIGSGHVDYGFNVPMAMDLPSDFGLGMMAQVDFTETSNDLSTMVTVGHDLGKDFGMYTEFFNTLTGFKGDAWIATFDTGLTYDINTNLQLDLGVNWGLTEAAEKAESFLGFTARF